MLANNISGPKTDKIPSILNEIETNKVKKRTLFNKTILYLKKIRLLNLFILSCLIK